MQSLELKLPPPAVTLIVALLMWALASMTPALRIVYDGSVFLAGACILIGVVVDILGLVAFRAARTTVNPMKPERASVLVKYGIYRFTRNPMYLGLLLDLVGVGFFLSNPLVFALLPVYVLYLNRFQIEPEERVLTARFGEGFAAYKEQVRRWI
ncbi:MAG TPA: isoprenylcysteine carboxylmethyltransferase family protein [Burkholderiaceae bacterium]|jgi:protein-S-isoprenylcysteine O-methyltransferase Ste14|nr:isoprenylcysteine carboxylmethyltransferase family protein [Burkholderiaceae bacterium]